jgi:1,4-dihydroxy-2-naphthoate polyprenyltransferase
MSSIIVGSAIAHYHGILRADVMALALLTAVLLQILSNLANDLGDHEHGTDNVDRIGPMRAVQSGVISPAAMKRAMLLLAVLAFLSGLALIMTALGLTLTMLAFLLLGILALMAAVKYTFGSNPYGYAGLGDVSVFLFFGPVGVLGTYYLHTLTLDPLVLLPAAAFGLLSAGVLNVNNMRDRVNDAASGKRTLVVRLGADKARTYHSIMLMTAVLLLFRFADQVEGPWIWLFIAGLIPVVWHAHLVTFEKVKDHELDPELKRLALGTFATAVTLSIGLWIS